MQIKKEHVREQLVQAATKEFIKYGYNDSSLRRIVKSVNLSTGTFYTYFKDKDEVFEFIISPWTNILAELVKYAPKEPMLIRFHQTEDPSIIYNSYLPVLEKLIENKVAAYIYLLRSEGSKFQDEPRADIAKQVDYVFEIFSREIFLFENEPYIDRFFLNNFYTYFLNFLMNVLKNNIPFPEAQKKLKDMVIFMTEGWIGLKESKKIN